MADHVELLMLPETEYRPRDRAGKIFWYAPFNEIYFVKKGKQRPDFSNCIELGRASNNYRGAMKAALRLMDKLLKFEALDTQSKVS